MDQKNVVGVGNIYASEALFAAGLRPTRRAGTIKRTEAKSLVTAIREILSLAIDSGGSSIRDYRNAEGRNGKFQTKFSVYDRAGEPCSQCQTKIRSRVIAGRTTYWCPACQS